MTPADAPPFGWQEAFVIVGILCIAAGYYLRPRGTTLKGLSVALMTVGGLLIVAWPLGRVWRLW